MAGIRFQQHGSLHGKFVREVMATTQPFGQNQLKEAGGRKIIYLLNTKERAVTATSYSFVLQKVKSR